MKKLILLAILLIAVFLIGCETTDTPTEDTEVTNGDTEDVKINLPDIFQKTGSFKCQAVVEQQGEEATSVIWVKDGNLRSEATVSGVKMISLYLGDWAYNWIEGEIRGTKMNMNDLMKLGEGVDTEIQAKEDFVYDQPNIICEAENIPDSTFEIPLGVEFIDMGAQLLEMQEQIENMQDQLPEGQFPPGVDLLGM